MTTLQQFSKGTKMAKETSEVQAVIDRQKSQISGLGELTTLVLLQIFTGEDQSQKMKQVIQNLSSEGLLPDIMNNFVSEAFSWKAEAEQTGQNGEKELQ